MTLARPRLQRHAVVKEIFDTESTSSTFPGASKTSVWREETAVESLLKVKVELLVWPCQIIRFVACIPQVRKQTKYICFRFSIGQVEIGVNVDDNIEGAIDSNVSGSRKRQF